jgi:23S rRNA G2445 N2-methylase RlmL
VSRTRSRAEVRAALADPGFTPGARDVAPLVELVLADEEMGDAAARVLPRAGAAAVQAALARSAEATPRGRVRLARIAVRAGTPTGDEARAWLVRHLADAEPAVRRAAAAELGKPALASADVAPALQAALAGESDASTRRALMAALGKIGGEGAAAALDAAAPGSASSRTAAGRDRGAGDASTERVRSRAALMAARPAARGAGVRIELDRPPPRATPVILHCRNGLEPLLVSELAKDLAAGPAQDGFGRGGRVAAMLRDAPATLLRSRIMLEFGFPLPVVEVAAHGGLPEAIAAALGGERAAEVLATCTRAADGAPSPVGQLPAGIRYRIRWTRAGKRRAQVWDAALAIRAARPELVNDPSDSDWQVVVHELAPPEKPSGPPPRSEPETAAAQGAARSRDARVLVELQPRFVDPRFAYRVGDVPAASHPTVAAALVHASAPRHDDVVWDPFVGSGLELCERARAATYARLIGSDLRADARETARRNLESVGAERFELLIGDARSLQPPVTPTVVITNPPMGRRVHRGGMLEELLAAFLRHAAATLAPRGRLVWVSPLGDKSARAAAAAGLRLGARHAIDMGGFVADLEVWHKR